MQLVFELEHNGVAAYQLSGKDIICDVSVNQKVSKAYKIKLTASNDVFENSQEIVVKKVTDGWTWYNSNTRFPLIAYTDGGKILDQMFPAAQIEEVYVIYVAIEVLQAVK